MTVEMPGQLIKPGDCLTINASGNAVRIGCFLNAMTDEHIALLTPKQREVMADFFAKSSERFRDRTGNIPGSNIPWNDVRPLKAEGK